MPKIEAILRLRVLLTRPEYERLRHLAEGRRLDDTAIELLKDVLAQAEGDQTVTSRQAETVCPDKGDVSPPPSIVPDEHRTKMLYVRLTPTEFQRLKGYATRKGRTMSEIVRQLLAQTGENGL